MRSTQTVAVTLVCAAAAAAACLLDSCSSIPLTVVAPPDIPGAHYSGNQACSDCHANYVRVFPAVLTRDCAWKACRRADRAAASPAMVPGANTSKSAADAAGSS